MNAILSASAVSGQPGTSAPQPRLVRAAHEFEAQMMQELMKPMTHGSSLTGEDDDSDAGSGSGGALGEFASEALGKALSEHGGFGIARGIIHQLSHSGNQKVTTSVTGMQHVNTVIKALK